MSDLNTLWNPSSAEPPPSPPADLTDPFPPVAPVAPEAPASDDSGVLRQQLDYTQSLLQQVIQQRQQATSASPPSTHEPPARKEPRTYFSEDDVQMILNAPQEKLGERLNRAMSAAAQEFQEELQRRDERLKQLEQGITSQAYMQEQQRQQEYARSTFMRLAPDLVGTTPQEQHVNQALVSAATQFVQQEFQQQPWKFGNNPELIMQRIAEVARGYRGTLAAQSGTTPPPSTIPPAARRAAVETGGSTRVGKSPARTDPQHKAMDLMLKSMGKIR